MNYTVGDLELLLQYRNEDIKKLEKENEELKKSNELRLDAIKDVGKDNIELKALNREYIELIKECREYFKMEYGECCWLKKIDDLLEKKEAERVKVNQPKKTEFINPQINIKTEEFNNLQIQKFEKDFEDALKNNLKFDL